jgi:hydrogenase assembly chaperone HypC/HupF
MCLDFPGRVVSREGDQVIVETDGRRRRATTLLVPDIDVGEWVYVAAGTVIERLDAASAEQVTAELNAAKGATP